MFLFGKEKVLHFEKEFDVPIEEVWEAFTNPEILKQWWGPDKTIIPECQIDVRVGGKIRIVMEASESMGSYAGTRWPMEGTFTTVEKPNRLQYEAEAWTDGKKDTTTIEQVNDLLLTTVGEKTKMEFVATIKKTGVKASLAAFGMKMGYNSQFSNLELLLNKE